MESVNKENQCKLTVELTSVTPHEYKSKGKGITVEYGFANTPFGECFIGGSENGICMFQFCDDDHPQLIDELKKEWTKSEFQENDIMVQHMVEKIFYPQLGDMPIKLWLKGTPFQFRVWKILLDEVHPGSIISYGNLARIAGIPNATRAVASAVARNPAGFIIPCHRVVRSNGDIGQYHWKPERKTKIIEWEKSRCRIIS